MTSPNVSFARRDIIALHHGRPDRAGIFDIGVDVVGGECRKDDVGAEPLAATAVDAVAAGLDPLRHQGAARLYCSENVLAPMM